MVRKKAQPKNLDQVDKLWLSNDINGYIPVIKKKTSKRKKPSRVITYKIINPSEEVGKFYMGDLILGTTNTLFPEEYSTCSVLFNEELETMNLNFDNTIVVVMLSMDMDIIKDILGCKMFPAVLECNDETISIKVYMQLPLEKFYFKVWNCLKFLFLTFYNISDEKESDEVLTEKSGNSELTNIYDKLYDIRKQQSVVDEDVQHKLLKPVLRPYQQDAVRWMLSRERNDEQEDGLHPLYTPVTLKSGTIVYFDKYTGYVNTVKPRIPPSSRGGILGDEMGMGKTVEVLACILLNKKPVEVDADTSKPMEVEEEIDEDEEPLICRQKKKRRMRTEKPSDVVDEPKKIKVPEDWVKTSSRKLSANRVALEMWYNSTLVSVNAVTKYEEPLVLCICGNSSERDLVKCTKCEKHQHKRCLGYEKSHGPYICPKCWLGEPLLDSGATLIVTPLTLRNQWCKEISKHLKSGMRVLQYEGFSATPIYPTQLKDYDIVITTYNVLQNELRLTESGEPVNFRRQRKYSPPSSPLIRISWWRLCLDEAQTVETAKMVASMASKLQANFRWAVTGTPVSKGISEIYSLLDYLQLSPYNDITTWKHVLHNPYLRGNYEPICNFLSKILWRTAKCKVLNQINIPKQIFKEHLLEFSSIEKFFYRKEHELSREEFLAKLLEFNPNVTLESLDKKTIKKILGPLLTLRQACTHPNTVRGRYLATKKQITSMEDLLGALILKNTNESEEMLRSAVSALNGLAGISLILDCKTDAVNYYRRVLQLSSRFVDDKNETKLTVDKLQIIHSMHNLAEILENSVDVEPTLRDGSLRKDCSELEKNYIEKFIGQTADAYTEAYKLTNHIEDLQEKFVLRCGQWYSDGFNWVSMNDHYNDLWNKIHGSCGVANVKCNYDYNSARMLLYAVSTWDKSITNLRADLIEGLSLLFTVHPEEKYKININEKLVNDARDCHLRKKENAKKSGKICQLCVVNSLFKKYEVQLYTADQRKASFQEMSVEGTWKIRFEEIIIKSLLSILKSKHSKSNYINDGEIHVNILDNLKKEFKELRKFWTYLDQQICGQDELSICKIRMCLKVEEPEDEKKTDEKKVKSSKILKNLDYRIANRNENLHVLGIHEISFQESLLKRQEKESLNMLEKSLGTQKYLQSLKKHQYEGKSPDPCPICKNSLENHWSILQCGHSYCLECMQALLEKSQFKMIQCSMCRTKQKVDDISYIKAGETVTETETLNIVGNYSSKIEAVIKLIYELRNAEPDVKILLFSSWPSVLKCFKIALDKNLISNEIGLYNLQDRIEKFKDPDKKVTILLMPISLGSKGLNLIEATHVILIEPLLNPADELQAIGRVHRIGQTKQTYVHKFFVQGTIEDSIQKATSSNVERWDKTKITIQQLTDLFA